MGVLTYIIGAIFIVISFKPLKYSSQYRFQQKDSLFIGLGLLACGIFMLFKGGIVFAILGAILSYFSLKNY